MLFITVIVLKCWDTSGPCINVNNTLTLKEHDKDPKAMTQLPNSQDPNQVLKCGHWQCQCQPAQFSLCALLFWENMGKQQSEAINSTISELVQDYSSSARKKPHIITFLKYFWQNAFFFCLSQLYAVFGFLVDDIINPGALKIHTITCAHHHIITSLRQESYRILWCHPEVFLSPFIYAMQPTSNSVNCHWKSHPVNRIVSLELCPDTTPISRWRRMLSRRTTNLLHHNETP